ASDARQGQSASRGEPPPPGDVEPVARPVEGDRPLERHSAAVLGKRHGSVREPEPRADAQSRTVIGRRLRREQTATSLPPLTTSRSGSPCSRGDPVDDDALAGGGAEPSCFGQESDRVFGSFCSPSLRLLLMRSVPPPGGMGTRETR